MKEYHQRINDEYTDSILKQLDGMIASVKDMKDCSDNKIYSNHAIMENLGISDKVLVQYRNDGLLPYSKVFDKYWYTSRDVNTFMLRTKVVV